MSYIWKEGEPRANNTVDVDGFNSEYNAYKSMLNGGLDRDNLPQASIGNAEYVYDSTSAKTSTPFFRGVVHHFEMNSDYRVYSNATLGSHSFASATYAVYNSGWVEASSQALQCKEGMLQIEARGWVHLSTATAAYYPRVVVFQITVDNVPVIETVGGYMAPIGAFYLVGSTPVAEGNVRVGFRWKFSPSGSDGSNNDAVGYPQMFFAGTSMSILNRFR
jgi:hypothetical protein